MEYIDFQEITGIIADSFQKVSVGVLYGMSHEELFKIPTIAYPKEVYEYLVKTSNMIQVADRKVYLVGFQWQFIQSL